MSRRSHPRGGYTLLEVVVSMVILVTSLVLFIQIQASAVEMTTLAEEIVTGTQLAEEKMSEARMRIEMEGVTQKELHEEGDFSELGDDALDLEFGARLDDYHWEYWISEIDLGIAGDLAGMAENLAGTGLVPGADAASNVSGDPDVANVDSTAPDLSALGISNEMITEMLGRYVREVRVRVWWGESSREAEERGQEVILTAHAIDPAGSYVNLAQQGIPQ
jgi:hypothetical protein